MYRFYSTLSLACVVAVTFIATSVADTAHALARVLERIGGFFLVAIAPPPAPFAGAFGSAGASSVSLPASPSLLNHNRHEAGVGRYSAQRKV